MNTKNAKTLAQPDVRLLMNYIGAMTLLGRVARNVPEGSEDRYGLTRAFHDANNFMLVNEREIRFEPDSSGGWSPFTVEQSQQIRQVRHDRARK